MEEIPTFILSHVLAPLASKAAIGRRSIVQFLPCSPDSRALFYDFIAAYPHNTASHRARIPDSARLLQQGAQAGYLMNLALLFIASPTRFVEQQNPSLVLIVSIKHEKSWILRKLNKNGRVDASARSVCLH
jgi:hypothetical protein